jgi:prolipoprotein diacylglyceryltransferase
VQLYESFGYLLVFLILRHLYWNTNRKDQTGYLFGVFFILLFGVRFIAEFVKESQGGFETSLGLLSTGQWLSIPLILIGFYLVRTAMSKAKST